MLEARNERAPMVTRRIEAGLFMGLLSGKRSVRGRNRPVHGRGRPRARHRNPPGLVRWGTRERRWGDPRMERPPGGGSVGGPARDQGATAMKAAVVHDY